MARRKPATSVEDFRGDFQPPRPLRAIALVLAPLPALVALWAAGVLPAPVALGLGAFQLFFALVQGGLGTYELHRDRRLGDALLRAHPGVAPVSGLAAWRSAELTSARNRRRLTRLVRRLRRETEACLPTHDSPVAVLDESVDLLRQLEYRLALLSEPVSAIGMLELHTLAEHDHSPLYVPERARALPGALSRALAALEPA